ncbi:MAG: hypothetical protein A3A97_02660 [Candidatus Terrybacteria bacterium RIFCSPLOWO2_01_FULL_40_23]|uniref:Uncharacterized protein n=1 Tax=Candidatus Terrybacteria bacterium RIFCSPLOWO2_01_FULL_40_23 TaxID=1802366 RepID=A0A1G2PUJ1_9BACT|nr:MAG: hypothetical protein A3A97_02660 [Candidatus Terrybacteria bacterium RIFCSPLOWO2_01_FULL_40_23]
MIKKSLGIVMLGFVVIGTFLFFRFSNSGMAVLWGLSKEGTWLLPLVVVASLIDSINPCAFSILLVTIAFLFSLGRMRSSILTIGGFYIAGIFTVYVLIGLGILQALHLFNTPHFMSKVGAFMLIGLGGINLINEFFPSFPIKLKIPDFTHKKIAQLVEKASLPTAFFMGALVGLCEFPCTGGPYLLVLGLLHDQGTYIKGLGYLLLYNIIFVLPLVLVLLMASDNSLLSKVQRWRKNNLSRMRLFSGIAMVTLGLIILSM